MKSNSSIQFLKLKIKTINSDVTEIQVENNLKISELKRLIENKLKIPTKNQRLLYQGKLLNDEMKVIDYKIEDEHVIHLVENNLENIPNNINNSNQIRLDSNIGINVENRYTNFLNMLLNSNSTETTHNASIHNSNYMNSLFNLHNSTNLTQNNSSKTISESYKSLEKQTGFNKLEMIEVIKQNINIIKEITKNTINVDNLQNSYKTTKNLFNVSNQNNKRNLNFKIGQWVDCKDTLDLWIEAQIIDIKDDKAHVKFNGWNDTWNEWINLESPRLAIFRTYTIQSPFSKYNSTFPNSRNLDLIFTDVKDFDKFDNFDDLINFVDLLRERIIKIIHVKEAFFAKKMRATEKVINDTEILNREKILALLIMQIYPIMDRLGRLMTDFANYLFNYSFQFFEENFDKFKSNLNEDISFRNLNREEVLNNKISLFEKFANIPVMRNSGEVAESYNYTRPRVGVVIGVNTGNSNSNLSNLREENIRNSNINTTNSNTSPTVNRKFTNLNFKKENDFSILKNSKKLDLNKDFKIYKNINFSVIKCIKSNISNTNTNTPNHNFIKNSSITRNISITKKDKIEIEAKDKINLINKINVMKEKEMIISKNRFDKLTVRPNNIDKTKIYKIKPNNNK